jgi:phenylalanyl-tRNA synthetase beta subunit
MTIHVTYDSFEGTLQVSRSYEDQTITIDVDDMGNRAGITMPTEEFITILRSAGFAS